ncbi:peroxiredoxin [Allokutzneria oryzae]|uniref:thioredoxin-dependent peroxiredoxin n=1 Tax=Allokutzneria oryzae TaxID=1378989 RepID=A0ABV5ZQ86_9PSEU
MRPGDTVPDFTLPDQDGEPRTLSKLLTDGPVVLFFYPVASSGGCTVEACHFRDLGAEFAALGAQRVGISPDSVSKQKDFASRNSFDYPLLSDADGEVASQFGVKRKLLKVVPVKRHTFVIGTDRTLLEVIKSELKFEVHADEALAALKKHAA